MEITNCPHCGHSLLEKPKRPAGCVCEPSEWGNPNNIPLVCDKFDGNIKKNCKRCEHDYGCHAEAWKADVPKPERDRADLQLLAKYGEAKLREMGYMGVIDRLERGGHIGANAGEAK